MKNLSEYHPYWSADLARRYDKRASEVRMTLRSNAAISHERLLVAEYGSMSREEFDLRVDLAKTADVLRQRWLTGSRTIVDPSMNLGPDLTGDRLLGLAASEPIYVHLGASATVYAAENILLDGLYIERLSRDGEADMFGMGVVCRPFVQADHRMSLADLLYGQSVVSYGLTPSLNADADIDVVVKDPALDDPLFHTAFLAAVNGVAGNVAGFGNGAPVRGGFSL
ncbi:hypothetical protein ASG19_07070 [Rhizobium sp. Leaf306]|uniref:hypothetical protein n=1 Tax=Rhizobium sp. Leaf306 TaxID=1736330 RepID=UPI000713818D|nr:hypothetical protein [Rhizobium sp. Leaf306]KQQ38767.1 hypothetical protein ASG19_07070 [Rhizobium sp. Leaf306]